MLNIGKFFLSPYTNRKLTLALFVMPTKTPSFLSNVLNNILLISNLTLLGFKDIILLPTPTFTPPPKQAAKQKLLNY